jgi:hypothetical protein
VRHGGQARSPYGDGCQGRGGFVWREHDQKLQNLQGWVLTWRAIRYCVLSYWVRGGIASGLTAAAPHRSWSLSRSTGRWHQARARHGRVRPRWLLNPSPVHAQFSCSLFSTLSFLSFSLLFLSLFFFSSLLLSLSLFPFLSSFLSLSSLSLFSLVSDRRRLVVHADADADPCNARRFSSTRTVCPPARFGGALWVLLRSGLLAGGADAGLRRLAGEDGTQPRPPAIPAVFTLTST